jgi:hypothetical protein
MPQKNTSQVKILKEKKTEQCQIQTLFQTPAVVHAAWGEWNGRNAWTKLL